MDKDKLLNNSESSFRIANPYTPQNMGALAAVIVS
jgi:hypothetical protein